MVHLAFRNLAMIGPVILIILCVICSIAALVLYIGIAMCATLRSSAPHPNIRYQVFRDLLDLLRDIVGELVKLFRTQQH